MVMIFSDYEIAQVIEIVFNSRPTEKLSQSHVYTSTSHTHTHTHTRSLHSKNIHVA